MVRLAVEGDGEIAWVAALDGVSVTRRGQDYTEVEVAAGHDPYLILKEAIARDCRVLHFEITDPSLEEILIEKVGQIDISERTLAPKAVPA